jgi:CPA2 family monovalent cation:H+ antiporter-2
MGDLQALLPGLGEIASHPIDAQCPSVGRSLSELDLRGRTGANVVAISREGGSVLLPEGNERLRAGDLLGITGSHAACDAARTLLRKGLPAESVQEVEAERFGSDPPG